LPLKKPWPNLFYSKNCLAFFIEMIRFLTIRRKTKGSIFIYLGWVLLLALTGQALVAAQSYQDSLLNLIDSTDNPELLSIHYSELSKAFTLDDPGQGIKAAQRGYALADSINSKIGIALNSASLGEIYTNLNQLDSALTYYNKALDQFEALNDLDEYVQIKMIVGNIYLVRSKYIEAQSTYLDCLKICEEIDAQSVIPHLHNNLGVLYMDIEDYKDAKKYFQIAEEGFSKIGDEYDANLAKSNIFRILNIQGNSKEAIEGFLSLTNFFLKEKNWELLASIYNAIASIQLDKGDIEQAKEFIDLAIYTLNSNRREYSGPSSYYEADIYTTAAQIYIDLEESEKALGFARKAYNISESNGYSKNLFEAARILTEVFMANQESDSALYYSIVYSKNYSTYQTDRDVKQITQIRMQQEFDAIQKEEELKRLREEASRDRREVIYIGTTIIAILFTVLLVFLYKNQKIKADREILQREKIELEKEQLNQELTYKNKELATNMMYLLEKNEFIGSITTKMDEIRSRSKKENQSLIQEIIMELKRNSSSKIWEEFELRFKEVHSEFYNELHQRFPDLTQNEVRLSAFLRLGMSTKEISAITHQSVKSINVARFRLRKKIGIERDENLLSFLSQL